LLIRRNFLKKKRELLISEIKLEAVDWAIVAVGPKYVDSINIREASKLAMSLAVKNIHADFVLIDGNMEIDTDIAQQTVVKGDSKHVEISAASILAKVWRDNEMKELDKLFPGYGLEKHAGYPTKAHKQAIKLIGPSPIHRRTFGGVREFLNEDQINISYHPKEFDNEITIIKQRAEKNSCEADDWAIGRASGY